MAIATESISHFGSEFFGPIPTAAVFMPHGLTVAMNSAHRHLIGGSEDAVPRNLDDLAERINRATKPLAEFKYYGHYLSAITVLMDAHCAISSSYRDVQQHDSKEIISPRTLYRVRDNASEELDRTYLPSLLQGSGIIADRPHVLAVKVLPCPGVEVIVRGIPGETQNCVHMKVVIAECGKCPVENDVVIERSAENERYFADYQALQDLVDLDLSDPAELHRVEETLQRLGIGSKDITHNGFLGAIESEAVSASGGPNVARDSFRRHLMKRVNSLFDPLVLAEEVTPTIAARFDINELAFESLSADGSWKEEHTGKFVGFAGARCVVADDDRRDVLQKLSAYPKVPKFYIKVGDQTVYRAPSSYSL